MTGPDASALAIAAAVRARRVSARDVTAAALARIAERDGALSCFTHVRREAALADAARVDARLAAGEDPGPLAGVPFAVKNLFDVEGLTTLAGSKIFAERPPAARDAAAVAMLRRAGAVLVGTLNMDEFAFGFTTENAHHGPTRNPHDPSRVPGGSSGGSAAAVAAGLVPLTLGSDTNGSIRVPAAFCGIFGLKPTYGRVSRAGVALFAASLDHVGPFARSVADLAAAYDAIQGPDPADPVCSAAPVVPCAPHVGREIEGLRLAVASGHFARQASDEALAAVTQVARALRVTRHVEIPEAHRARAAAMVITASEGANLHLADLRTRAKDFDPLTRDRFLAGALLPASAYAQAQRFRAWYRARVAEIFQEVDVLLAPTTPWVAPPIGAPRLATVGGAEVVARAHSGVFTQPLSFVGLPVISVPVATSGPLPLGVQLVAAPFREPVLFRVAARLEADGVVAARLA
ncbi:MAG TPA: AtzE family amidohydrolase [Methylomirabilota bacterium]|nr:AtzE family amidohydrolase [Methylomirabilota bacterium]